jgi:soluble lytic murein transglycosylase
MPRFRYRSSLAVLPMVFMLAASPAISAEDRAWRNEDVSVMGALPMGAAPMRLASADPAQVREVIALYRKGDTAAADRYAAIFGDITVRTLLEWVAIRAGGPAITHARIAAFIDANPVWPGLPTFRKRAEEALLQEKATDAVVAQFFMTRQPVTAAGRIALARLMLNDGRGREGIELARRAWRREHMGAKLEDLVIETFGAHLTRADHRTRTERYLFAENREASLRNAARIGSDYVALAQARLASATKAGNTARLAAAVPEALRGDISFTFLGAQMLRRQTKPVEAARLLASVPRDSDLLGDGDEWWVERRLIARQLLDIGQNGLAYEVAARHGAISPASIIEAEWHAGWIALRFLDDPARAASHFATGALVAETPISVARMAFWQGRAAEALGLAEEADSYFRTAARHPVAYYGQLARDRLGIGDIAIRRAAAADPANLPAVAAARLLHAHADTRPLGAALLLELARHLTTTADLEAAAAVAQEAGDARTSLAFGKIALQRGYPLDSAAFPTNGVPDFAPVGEPVETAIVHAIARQESAFDPAAISPAGARGLMQMMPATARETARRTQTPLNPAQLTGDAAFSARLGAAHLGDLMKEWRGSHVLTFAAYNAGSGNVRDWIKAYGDPRDPTVDVHDWIERIPFTETRNYVQRVSENLRVYRGLMAERTGPGPNTPLITAARAE